MNSVSFGMDIILAPKNIFCNFLVENFFDNVKNLQNCLKRLLFYYYVTGVEKYKTLYGYLLKNQRTVIGVGTALCVYMYHIFHFITNNGICKEKNGQNA